MPSAVPFLRTGAFSGIALAVAQVTDITVCNLVVEPSGIPVKGDINFTLGNASDAVCESVAFGDCCILHAQGSDGHVSLGVAMPSSELLPRVVPMQTFQNAARNYAVAYQDSPGQLSILAPSALFAEELPTDWNRYVWASACSSCGPVSAFVNDYKKQINTDGRPFACCEGLAMDETEGLPGPPQGAKGVWTEYRALGQQPGPIVANITFPWQLAEYNGREPFMLLLAEGVSAAILYGHPPQIFRDAPSEEAVLLA